MKCLEAEPALCVDMTLRVIVVIHVDDILMLGDFEKHLEILEEIRQSIRMRETG